MKFSKIFAINYEQPIEESDINKLLSLITCQEKERIGYFKQRKDKNKRILSHFLLKHVMKKIFNLNDDFKIKRTIFGKPMFENNISYSFNWSYSSPWLFLFVSNLENIGIDIEKINFHFDISSADIWMSLNELRNYKMVDNKHLYYFSYWTLKEAYLKALGIGLYKDMRDIDFSDCNKIIEDELYIIEENSKKWFLKQFLFQEKFLVSVCLNDQIFPMEIEILPMEKVLEVFLND